MERKSHRNLFLVISFRSSRNQGPGGLSHFSMVTFSDAESNILSDIVSHSEFG